MSVRANFITKASYTLSTTRHVVLGSRTSTRNQLLELQVGIQANHLVRDEINRASSCIADHKGVSDFESELERVHCVQRRGLGFLDQSYGEDAR